MTTKALASALAALALAGCANLHSLDNDVSTYSQWPAGRKPAGYAFERLPSQQARPEQQQQLENAARPAIDAAGFTLAADPASAEFSVQVGARTSANERWPFDDPFWGPGGYWHGPGFRHRGMWPGWFGPPAYYDPYSYQREVAVLIRDRKTGQALYEAHAVNDSNTPSFADGVLPAMYEAAMKDFPTPGINPRTVTIELPHSP
ncbi:MAG: DUF4136 domain-containing protein [Proteobacteria bacterium]|nr:DUF4136 domain-containing protein [Pseudomonadota bacterium]